MTLQPEIQIQRDYYTQTASSYNSMHVREYDEHFFALAVMVGLLDYCKITSILDIGSGTGRVLSYIKKHRPDIRIVGIEPVAELREIGYQEGLGSSELIEGDATQLSFGDGEFDLVCEFGVLHHIKQPERAVSEMLRVASKAIFISDSNNFGSGSATERFFKQLLNSMMLWPIVDFIKTRGKGYTITEGDGLAYSYSVFNNYAQIRKACQNVHLINTKDGHMNLYRTSTHIAVLGIKK
jgi:ubiquinone/menaquinone biosynthesis C-methylase UbiE